MGITRVVLGAVAAAGVARLLAPTETKKVIKSAKRAVASRAASVKRKAASMAKPMKAMGTKTVKRASAIAKKKSTARKAPRRPTSRKSSR
jgi:hypothetical protein